jgi:hypothetical protein
MVEDRDDSSPPFYTSLNIHDKVLHNCLMDSGASHNLMPKIVMEELGLEVTKAYHDLYSFDSRRVQCLGVIKDLVVSLFQLPMKSVVMDIVVADVPPKFGMLLSRSWIKKLGEHYRWISHMPPFQSLEGNKGGYIEKLSWPTLSVMKQTPPITPSLHLTPIWGLVYCSSLMLLKTLSKSESKPSLDYPISPPTPSVWKMFFDGASSSEGAGAGVVFISPCQEAISLSYKLEFEITNNVAEYEALVLGMRPQRKWELKR